MSNINPYVKCFEDVLKLIIERENCLFFTDELNRMKKFFLLDYSAKILVTRVLLRKGPWFRVDKLSYYMSEAHEEDRIPQTIAIVNALSDEYLIPLAMDSSIPEILDAMNCCMSLDEIRKIYYVIYKKNDFRLAPLFVAKVSSILFFSIK